MDYNLKSDYERLAKLNADQKSIIDAAELEGRKSLTESEEKQFDALHNEAVETEKMIERKKKIQSNEQSLADELVEKKVSKDEYEFNKKEYLGAMKNYLLKGFDISASDKEILTRAQSTSSSDGGYTIHSVIGDRIIKAMEQYGGVRQVATILSTSQGNQIDYPTNNDTANVATLLSEATAASELATTFGTMALNAYKYTSGYILASNELLQDSAFDLEAYFVELFADRFGRGLNDAYTNANGSSKPNGLKYAVTTTGVTLADQDAITFSEILTLKHSVDPAYRFNGKFMMNDSVLLAIKKLSIGSGDARPLWQPSFVAGEPATIDGSQYVINNDMDGFGSLKTPMFYGDFSKYIIRDVAGINIKRSTEYKFLEDQTAWVGFFRTDADLSDTRAIKAMKTLTLT